MIETPGWVGGAGPVTAPLPGAFTGNREYLSAELELLRERTATYIAARKAEPAPGLDDAGARRAALRVARERAVEGGVGIPLHDLGSRHAMSSEDEDLLLLCLAAHVSAPVWTLVLHAQGNVLKPYLEVGFASELLWPGATVLSRLAAFRSEAPLMRAGLLQLAPPPDGLPRAGLLDQAVWMPSYVARWLMDGEVTLDGSLSSFCSLERPSTRPFDVIVAPETRRELDELLRSLADRRVVAVTGPTGTGKTTVARAMATSLGRALLTLRLDRLPPEGFAPAVRLAASNAAFAGAVLHLDRPSAVRGSGKGHGGLLAEVCDGHEGVTVLEDGDGDGESLPPALERQVSAWLSLRSPEAAQRLELWESCLPPDVELGSDVELGTVSATYELSGGQIRRAADRARARASSRKLDRTVRHEDLVSGASAQLRGRLDHLTDRGDTPLGLGDLVLPEDTLRKVRDLLAACGNRHRVLHEWGFGRRIASGRGIVALLCGEAGTGKTLTAQILAAELGLELSTVCIPKIVSKWVGDTEKHLRELFRSARAESSMLLFDEADSLFTTRVKVERSQDHFQNLEVNTLLQEIERYEGIVVLTTNLETSIDRAFQRRILMRIEFPRPAEAERAAIWRTLIPKEAPLEGPLDMARLAAAFDLTGGQIKNAVLQAAYACCAAGTGLSQAALCAAANDQAAAAGKLVRAPSGPARSLPRSP